MKSLPHSPIIVSKESARKLLKMVDRYNLSEEIGGISGVYHNWNVYDSSTTIWQWGWSRRQFLLNVASKKRNFKCALQLDGLRKQQNFSFLLTLRNIDDDLITSRSSKRIFLIIFAFPLTTETKRSCRRIRNNIKKMLLFLFWRHCWENDSNCKQVQRNLSGN